MTQLQSIHESIYDAAYADTMRDGKGAMLIITYRDKGGIVLRGTSAHYWATELKTAVDQIEADQICKSLLNNS